MDCVRPEPIRKAGAIGDTERRKGTTLLGMSPPSESHSVLVLVRQASEGASEDDATEDSESRCGDCPGPISEYCRWWLPVGVVERDMERDGLCPVIGALLPPSNS